MKSPSWMHLFPTGGLSRCRFCSIQACRLSGAGRGLMAWPSGGLGTDVLVLADALQRSLVAGVEGGRGVQVDAQVVDPAIAQAIDPAVQGELLAAGPGVAHDGGAAEVDHL